ncbi:serine/threonine-protein kinase [Bifidobacterium asteroides]|uniref:non-specific serine/threonine protein kinase n=1 Tax=Bifidobacterium asteroides TaxID=1684 RepID=A0A6N7TTX8_9BIFI|nr:serine/threonine-protein kinase [Bifidobacterium asteroides]MSD90806.1 protein kinase [Bifidobacterium asteroides]
MSDLEGLDLRPGRLVGGYTLIEPLGGGAMGSVWRARDGGGQDYAMKILRESLEEDPVSSDSPDVQERASARERLRREALALQRIRHPGVCRIVDMELDDALAFIVTELIEGRNLRDDVAVNGPYRGDDLERLARKLTDAVAAVHQAGIVHRDIKPTNVMISVSGPVLVDFGIAMGQGQSHVTRTGLVMGTPGFIAPEIIDGAEADQETDWWSTAAVLAYAATGRAVFGDKPMMAVLEREASGNADLSGLPVGTMRALRSALSPDRSARCTPQELLEAISRDAMDPQAWQGEQDGKGSQETMRPFGGGSSEAEGRADSPTMVVEPATMPMPPITQADPDSPRTAWSQPPTDNRTDEQTTLLPDSGQPTRFLNPLPAAQEQQEQTQTWQDQQPLADRRDLQATTVQDPLPPAQPLPSGYRNEADAHWLGDQPPAQMRRLRYLRAGTPCLVMLGILPALLTALAPVSALAAAGILLWALSTAGWSIKAQIERELRREGPRRSTDRLLNAAALPWHLLKGLAAALLRLPGMVLVQALVALPLTWAGAFTTVRAGLTLGDHLLTFPLPAARPLSAGGLAMALATLVGWLLTTLPTQDRSAPKANSGNVVLRLAAGRIPMGRQDPEAPGSPHRRWILLLIWLLIIAVLLAGLIAQPSMDWAPIHLLRA